MSSGTLRCPGVFSGLFILSQNLPQYILKSNITCIIINFMMRLMKINLQINKKMIKMNKQKYFNVSFRYSRASWGVLGCPGVIRLTLIFVPQYNIDN